MFSLTHPDAGGCDMQEQEGWEAAGGCQAAAAASPSHQQLGKLAQDVWQQVGCRLSRNLVLSCFIRSIRTLKKKKEKETEVTGESKL